MRRRAFIILSGSAVGMQPFVAGAQSKAMPVIGYLHSAAPDYAPTASVFLEGLRDAGFVVGKNVAMEYRFAEGHYDRLPALAAELVARKVDLIVAMAPPPAIAAKRRHPRSPSSSKWATIRSETAWLPALPGQAATPRA